MTGRAGNGPGRLALRWVPAVVAILTLFSSCRLGKQLNRRLSLWRKDDIPYGTQIAYDALPFLFPDAEVSINRGKTIAVPTGEGRTALIIVTGFMDAEARDVALLMIFVGEGNVVFISANRLSEDLLKNFSIHATNVRRFTEEPDSLTVGVYDPVSAVYGSFSYPGDSYDNYVTRLDSQYVSVLGRDGHGRPDFVRINYKGGGAVYLQFAPLAFSNFFLLHRQNIAYYEKALSYIPASEAERNWKK